MNHETSFYIDGAWCKPSRPDLIDVINPATEEVVGQVGFGAQADVDCAVQAARRAFDDYSRTDTQYRVELLDRIANAFRARSEDIAQAITREMGSPITFSRTVQTPRPLAYFEKARDVLRGYAFEQEMYGALVRREAIGVCGLITPWNWPLGQVASKLGSALAAGCTVILKPSEIAPLSAIVLAEIMHEAGVPAGVFNLINGDGPTVGHAISSHPDIDMVSFTGSTRAGILIAKAAADSVKRVTQELGGKSANIVLADADLDKAITQGTLRPFANTGQSCQAPTRILVQRGQVEQAMVIAARAAAQVKVGDPLDPATTMGPLANKAQFQKVQAMIQSGIDEGATLVCGGLGRPEGITQGHFVRPTVFANVTPSMIIAQEEIFGPVLSMLTYDTDDDAIAIANGTNYGLAAYVQSGDPSRARRVAERLRAGRVYVNGADAAPGVPFGGYKGSGNGREQGILGLEEFLEVKAIIGDLANANT